MKNLKYIFVAVLFFLSLAVVSSAQSQQNPDRELSIQISGFQSTGDRFVFRDHNSREFVFNANETRIWGRFPVGSAYNLTQISGPRQCRMINNQGTVPDRNLVISANCSAQSQAAQREISVQISGFNSVSDRFVFRDQTSREHSFNSNETRSLGGFSVGSTYSLTQTSGPRSCRMTNNQGTVPNSDVVISINCAAQSQNAQQEISIQISGFRSISDRFTFRDQSSRELVFNANETRIWGRFPIGSAYSLTQTSGPRQCRMTNNQGTVSNANIMISIDCAAPANSNINIQTLGIGAGESFTFRDSFSISFSSNETRIWTQRPVGSNYDLKQVGGSRQCVMTNNKGIVPATDITIIIDCTKSTAPPNINVNPLKIDLKLQLTGIEAGEIFKFKTHQIVGGTNFTESKTVRLGNYAYGSSYFVIQNGGPRNYQMSGNNQGNMTGTEVLVTADCSKPAAQNPPPVTGKFGDFDLVSRSIDQKSFGTFYGSVTPSIGGVDDTGVTEGQFVAYLTSWNIDPKHGGKARQIIWFNRGNGRTAVASRGLDGMGGDKDSYEPVIDSSGYNVAFESGATNLVEGDTNKVSDVFLWKLVPDDEVSCVSCHGNAASYAPSISRYGSFVAFVSNSSNLTAGVDGTSEGNVYLKDMRSGEITLISKDPKTGKGAGGRNPSISEDGSRIAFYSYSDKLADGDNNKLWDILVWERGNPKLKRISLTSTGQERDQGSESTSRIVKPTISGNGKYVTFTTTATNMGGAQTKPQNVYVAEIDTGRIICASSSIENTVGNDDSPIEQGDRIPISYDGKWVAFTTKSTNLGGKIILKNIETGEMIPFVTNNSSGVGTPTLSRNGRCIAFPANEKLDKRFDSTGIFTTCR